MTIDLHLQVVGSVDTNDFEICGRKKLWLIYDTETWCLQIVIDETQETSSSRQRLGKQISATTDTQEILDECLGVFSIQSVQSGYKEEFS
jgi:hypothetical protein